MRVAKTKAQIQTFFQQLISKQPGIAESLRRLQNVFKFLQIVDDKAEAMAAFEIFFRSGIPKEHRSRIYDLSVEIATEFCEELVASGKKAADAEETDIFPFPFTGVPLSDFEGVNAIWRAMDRALGKTEGPRFVHFDTSYFGIAKEYSFKGVPVIQFTNIITGSGSREYFEGAAIETRAFAIPGVEQIFVLPNEQNFESYLGKALRAKTARTMWEYAAALLNESSIASARFVDKVNDFMFSQRLLHEYGHLLSFKDESVSGFVLKPVISRDGKEYIHPSFERFYDLGEVYAELYGVIDRIIEERNTLFFILAFAYHARNFFSHDKHARTKAFAFIPLLRRNFSVERERNEIMIDWEGLREDVDAQKTFIYSQYEEYSHLTEEEEKRWVEDGIRLFYMRTQLSKAFGYGKKPDPSDKKPVETFFRDQAVAELRLEVGIPLRKVHSEIEEVRKENGLPLTSNESEKEIEERIAYALREKTDSLLTKFVAEAVEDCIAETLGLERVSRGSLPFVRGTDLSSYVNTVNDLMRAADRISSSFYCRQFIKEKPTLPREHFWGGDMADQMWDYLLGEGYIDGKDVLPKFDGDFDNFTVPRSLKILKQITFDSLERAVEQKARWEQELLTAEELREIAQGIERTLSRFSNDPFIKPIAKKALQMIQQDLKNISH